MTITKVNMNSAMKILFVLLTGVFAVALLSGCQTGPKSTPLISVIITNQPEAAIVNAVDAVFVSHGYSGGRVGANQFSFHRTATSGDNLPAGDYEFDSIVTLWAILSIAPIDSNSTLLCCEPSLVEGTADSPYGGGKTVHQVRKAPYEQMLKEVRAQFGQ